MPRHIHLEPHLTEDDLQKQYRAAADPVERSHWHFLWLLASGLMATAVAAVTGYSAYWIGQIAKRYNTDGPDGVRDRRHTECAGRTDLSASQLAELGVTVAGPHPDGDRWCGRTVAAWLSARLGRRVSHQLGWRYLRRLGARWLKPRPRHVRADSQAQTQFKLHLRPLLRDVATAFPHSPELQPAEHLLVAVPLTNTVLVNRHLHSVASIEELEDAQAERCVALQGQQNLIRSATRFSWWPRQIHRRHGPRAREEGYSRAGNTDHPGAANPRGSTRSPARQLHLPRTGDAPPAGRLRVLSCKCRVDSSDEGRRPRSRSWERSE